MYKSAQTSTKFHENILDNIASRRVAWKARSGSKFFILNLEILECAMSATSTQLFRCGVHLAPHNRTEGRDNGSHLDAHFVMEQLKSGAGFAAMKADVIKRKG